MRYKNGAQCAARGGRQKGSIIRRDITKFRCWSSACYLLLTAHLLATATVSAQTDHPRVRTTLDPGAVITVGQPLTLVAEVTDDGLPRRRRPRTSVAAADSAAAADAPSSPEAAADSTEADTGPRLPARAPRHMAPWTWEQSSISGTPASSASARRPSMSAMEP